MVNDDTLISALGITVATTTAPLPRPVWVGTHRILIVSDDLTEDDVLALVWERFAEAA